MQIFSDFLMTGKLEKAICNLPGNDVFFLSHASLA